MPLWIEDQPVDKSIPRTFRLSILRAYEVEYDFTTEESGSELFQSWWWLGGGGGGTGEQNALKMEKRLRERFEAR